LNLNLNTIPEKKLQMLNPINFITKFIKSSNQKELDRLIKIVEKINSHEVKFEKLDDASFPSKTKEFKERIKF